MKNNENETELKKIYKCPKCKNESILNKDSYKQAIKHKRLCRSCAMKKWQLEKYGKKENRIFTLECPRCKRIKTHKWKNQSIKQLERVKKDLSKKLCKSCSNSINYILPKIKFNTKPEREFKKILEELKIEYIQGYKLENKIFDFYINKLNILIEIDGNYWHGKNLTYEEMNPTQIHNSKNDKIKNLIAKENNIELLRFWEDEINKQKIIKRLYEQKTSNLE